MYLIFPEVPFYERQRTLLQPYLNRPHLDAQACADATLEALIVLLAQNFRGVALIQDELSGWARARDQ
jgi:hypothetical protein